MSNLVLASSSPSRTALLKAAGVAFSICAPDIDESAIMAQMVNDDTEETALLLAERKALCVSKRFPGCLVLGGDSVIEFEKEKLSKCATLHQARTLLARLCGKTHLLVTAAILVKDSVPVWRHASLAQMSMRAFSPEFLDAYLTQEGETILSSVGCYHLEGRGAQLFETVEGDYFSILGIPLLAVLSALRAQGVLAS